MNKVNPNITNRVYTMYRNIRQLRERNGLTTKQMAEIIDINEEKLIISESCVVTGCLYDIHIKNICNYFKISADDLYI